MLDWEMNYQMIPMEFIIHWMIFYWLEYDLHSTFTIHLHIFWQCPRTFILTCSFSALNRRAPSLNCQYSDYYFFHKDCQPERLEVLKINSSYFLMNGCFWVIINLLVWSLVNDNLNDGCFLGRHYYYESYFSDMNFSWSWLKVFDLYLLNRGCY